MTNNVKVEQYYNKNQFIIYCKGEIYLQSYNSTVAAIKTDHTLTLGKDWDYSNTTRKAIQSLIDKNIISYNPDLGEE